MPTKDHSAAEFGSEFSHLHPSIRHLATADAASRKAAILTDRWVSYPAGEGAIETLFELLDMPPRTRMPSVLFWASSNMGKTAIQRRFVELCAARRASSAGVSANAALQLEMNDELTEKRLYVDILTALNAPTPDTTAARLQQMVLRQLSARGTRLLLIDEIQRLTEQRIRDQRVVLNVLKYLSNQLSISIAGFGSGEARALIKSDIHLAERFEVIALPSWSKREAWAVEMVAERISLMPLRERSDVGKALMEALFNYSEGLLGRVFSLLERAGVAALEREECITPELIEAVALRKRRNEDG